MPAPQPIRRKLLRELALLSGVSIPLLVGISWFGLVRVVHAQAQARTADNLQSLDAQVIAHFDRIEKAARSLALLWREGLVNPGDPDVARLQVSTVLSSLPGPASVMMVRAGDGVSFFAWNRNGRRRSEVLRPIDGLHTRSELWTDDEQGRPLSPAASALLDYNPLQRPWIYATQTRDEPGWTEPYEFATFPAETRDRTLGMTYGVPVRTAGGSLIGFVGIDVSLDDLRTLARAVRPTPSSLVAVLDGQDRLLASSRPPDLTASLYLKPIGAEHSPVIHGLIQAGAGESRQLNVAGRTWFGRIVPSTAMRDQSWRFAVAIPEGELIGDARWQVTALFLALAVVVVLAGLRVMDFARRLALVLDGLGNAARQVGRDAPLELPASDIAEVEVLRETLQKTHGSLHERKRLEDELLHSQRVGLVGLLAGGAAHDINNQLTTIIAGISQARSASRVPPGVDDVLRAVEAACWRAVEMTRQLLALSRRGAPNFRSVHINDVVEQTAGLLQRVVDETVKLELSLAGDVRAILADPVQLEQVLLNLALNARDAMPNGGTLRIETRRRNEGGVVVVVGDSGVGMDADVRARIFEPFFTTKEGRGTGLGLAMVSNIIRNHGGAIEVESQSGRGTIFRIELHETPAASA